jgi:hypothetical protein
MRLAVVAVLAVSSLVVACASETGPDAVSGGEALSTPMCPEGLGNLQPGKKGGPDAKKLVSCEEGFSLCRVDPKGSDNDVCGDADDCFACVGAGSKSKLSLACVETSPAENVAPLSIKLEIDGNTMTATEAGGTGHKGTLDSTFHGHGTPKVRYLIANGAAPFTQSEFEWNMIMLEKTALSGAERGQATVRLDAGDRSDWRFVDCAKAK